jgi:hypothetical protein
VNINLGDTTPAASTQQVVLEHEGTPLVAHNGRLQGRSEIFGGTFAT